MGLIEDDIESAGYPPAFLLLKLVREPVADFSGMTQPGGLRWRGETLHQR